MVGRTNWFSIVGLWFSIVGLAFPMAGLGFSMAGQGFSMALLGLNNIDILGHITPQNLWQDKGSLWLC